MAYLEDDDENQLYSFRYEVDRLK